MSVTLYHWPGPNLPSSKVEKLQVEKAMKKHYEELKKQAKYRWEFFRRSESSQKILGYPELADWLSKLIEAGFGLCPIEVVYDGKKKDLVSEWLNYYEGDYFPKTDEVRKKLSKIKVHISLDGVDQKGKTITIKIHLDRKKEDIMKGVEYLLNTLKKEAKYFGEDFKRPRPRYEMYDDYLKVYDLRKNNPKMTWTKIAKEMFPEQVHKHMSPHRKVTKELVSSSAKDTVRKYWKKANKMINKEEWRQI